MNIFSVAKKLTHDKSAYISELKSNLILKKINDQNQREQDKGVLTLQSHED